MKTSDEMIQHLMDRRETYTVQRQERKKRAKKYLSVTACLCVAAIAGFSGVHLLRGIGNPPLSASLGESSTTQTSPSQQTPSAGSTLPSQIDTQTVEPSSAQTAPSQEEPSGGLISGVSEQTAPSQEEPSGGLISGVSEPFFIAYDGGIYVACNENASEQSLLQPLSVPLYFVENYEYTAYAVKDQPDQVAVHINRHILCFRRIFDASVSIDGKQYQPVYRTPGSECIGTKVREENGFAIYRMRDAATGAELTDRYLLCAADAMSALFPAIFEEYDPAAENAALYGDFWWILLP